MQLTDRHVRYVGSRRKLSGLRAWLALLAVVVVHAGVCAQAQTPASGAATYTNPVSAGVIDTFPDPSMIRGHDGQWYAYGTTNPIFNSRGEKSEHILPILRSPDMVHWTYAGDVYPHKKVPAYWPAKARAWAPDIRYVDGRYDLTYALSSGGIALLSAPTPTGPWTDHGLLVKPDSDGCPSGAIDQAMFTDTGGAHYLYWGSYDAICVSRMNADATALTGPVKVIARGRRAEGGYVVHHGDFYYLFYSQSSCCDGLYSGYTVKVGRARRPMGPFRAPSGQLLTSWKSKDGVVAAANGNRWVGPGHNAIQTDLSGQDWLVYHAIPDNDPDFPPVTGARGGTLPALAKRPLLIDRLDWVNGWPVLRAGRGPSGTPQRAPVTRPLLGSDFNHGVPRGWMPHGADAAWQVRHRHDAGGVLAQTHARAPSTQFRASKALSGSLWVQVDLQVLKGGGRAGLVVQGRDASLGLWIDVAHHQLVLDTGSESGSRHAVALPTRFNAAHWHLLRLRIQGMRAQASLASDGLGEPLANVRAVLDGPLERAHLAVATRQTAADFDNVSVAPLFRPAAHRVATPVAGAALPAFSDLFTGDSLPGGAGSAWHWAHGKKGAVQRRDGGLYWPTQPGDIGANGPSPAVLLRAAPEGDFMVQTKLTFHGQRPRQQAGLILYQSDARYLSLVHAVRGVAHIKGKVFQVTEFDKVGPRTHTQPARARFMGPMFGAAPARTTWLRLACWHGRGQLHARMASSSDGKHWHWGGTWSQPVDKPLQIGLVSMHGAAAKATFHDFRVMAYQPHLRAAADMASP
ncbi:family 43 glycosylhydrolase [Oleiagrimonas sp. C23AA]|uniref:family 43 glycosylhydrolase n=1 Tax=Oleiagrimonas sp. C23AA TaxID=2719047 RepID=UPI00141EC6AF|nr:family 43 glycosylhydrolase [Oleiagrimonas sp. C23AA]NII09269.1 family 43 glycosylhydrolase [Oleiagrimonas sp. C23AA]